MNTYIRLPFGRDSKGEDGFWSDALKRHLQSLPENKIPIGARRQVLASHDVPDGLDCWLRRNHVQRPDVQQAVNEVVEALVNTGDFEVIEVKTPSPGKNPRWIQLAENNE